MKTVLHLICLFSLSTVACHTKNAEATKPAEPAIAVKTAPAALQSVPDEIPLTGVLEAYERTELTANATGRVTKVLVELGQTVAAGAPIAQLDARSAALSEAEAAANEKTSTAQLETSKRDCERYEGLLAKGAVTQQEYDKAHGQCSADIASREAAKAKSAQAAQSVSDATIRAPFAGKIAAKTIHVGDYVHPDSKVVTLLSDNPLRLQLTVPEPNISSVHEGVKVRFESLGVPNRSFEAVVSNVGREVRAQTRDVMVEARVDNKEGALLSGMFTTAHLQTGESKQRVVPKSAVVTKDGESSLFLVIDKHLQQRAIHLGAPVGDALAITEGIQAGDLVVIDPNPTTADGALVQ